MKTELVRLTVTVTERQRELLSQWSDTTRAPVSYLIRQLIDEHFFAPNDD
jgi:hypothetical protein